MYMFIICGICGKYAVSKINMQINYTFITDDTNALQWFHLSTSIISKFKYAGWCHCFLLCFAVILVRLFYIHFMKGELAYFFIVS